MTASHFKSALWVFVQAQPARIFLHGLNRKRLKCRYTQVFNSLPSQRRAPSTTCLPASCSRTLNDSLMNLIPPDVFQWAPIRQQRGMRNAVRRVPLRRSVAARVPPASAPRSITGTGSLDPSHGECPRPAQRAHARSPEDSLPVTCVQMRLNTAHEQAMRYELQLIA